MHVPNHNTNVVISSNGQVTPVQVVMEDRMGVLGVQHLEDRVLVRICLFYDKIWVYDQKRISYLCYHVFSKERIQVSDE
jgi:hypothetical protein